MKLRHALPALVAVFTLTACNDSQAPTEAVLDAEGSSAAAVVPQQQHQGPQVSGRTIQNLDVLFTEGSTFTGRVVNLDFTDLTQVNGDLAAVASGRLVGRLTNPDGTTQQINETFENVALRFVDASGAPVSPSCPILFLELGPIFLDVLGLIVEVPDPIVVEIRAEPGPGRLLGNLLCALLGILDP